MNYDKGLHILSKLTEPEQIKILNLGISGSLKIFAEVPDDFVVFDIDENTRRLTVENLPDWHVSRIKEALIGNEPEMSPGVYKLCISPVDCKSVFRLGEYNTNSFFIEALKFHEGDTKLMRPRPNKKNTFGLSGKPSVFGRLFATYHKSDISRLGVLLETARPSVIVLSLETLSFIGQDYNSLIQKE